VIVLAIINFRPKGLLGERELRIVKRKTTPETGGAV